MKGTLTGYFSDIQVGGDWTDSPFIPGDEIEIYSIEQTCPDIGCCEVVVTFRHPDFDDGREVRGHIYRHQFELGAAAEEAAQK